MAEDCGYVVRGAKMKCQFGSHKRKINLPASHGSYTNGKPMMSEEDNKVVENITYFGICRGNVPGNDIVNLVSEAGGTITGNKCNPRILDKWVETKENTKVDGKAALTTKSKIFCAYGGEISFVDDGQHGG